MSVYAITENISIRKRKNFFKKSKSNDRRFRLKIKLSSLCIKNVDKEGINWENKNVDKEGINWKRSLKTVFKDSSKIPFRTTNLGKKRLNSRVMKNDDEV